LTPPPRVASAAMTILREKQSWKRDKPRRRDRLFVLTAEEEANVRAALRVLRIRYGGWAPLAEALGCKLKTLKNIAARESASKGYRHPTPGHALYVARLAGAPVEDVLSGAWPKPGSCPMCGRG
jgi:hypothetical protein